MRPALNSRQRQRRSGRVACNEASATRDAAAALLRDFRQRRTHRAGYAIAYKTPPRYSLIERDLQQCESLLFLGLCGSSYIALYVTIRQCRESPGRT
jgi:hypothetical protein